MHFNRQLEHQRRELLSELRPDAKTRPLPYFAEELGRLALEVARLQQVAQWDATPAAKAARNGGPKRRAKIDAAVVKLDSLRGRITSLAGSLLSEARAQTTQPSRGSDRSGSRQRRVEDLARLKGALTALEAGGVFEHADEPIKALLRRLHALVYERAARLAPDDMTRNRGIAAHQEAQHGGEDHRRKRADQ